MSTIFDVAKAAGVSKSTVSRVLNGESGVKEATREAVEKAIRELKYTPSYLAQVFAQARQRRLRWSCRNIRISFIMSFSGA